jgi:low temperature requirement protein LtrA
MCLILSLILSSPAFLIEFGATGIFLAIALVFIVLGSAFFAFVMLRKTVKMAIRLIIIGVILLIAVVGSASVLWFSSSSDDNSPKPRPANSRSR